MTPEQERHDITHAVGECLMTWAMVERDISILYCECFGDSHKAGAGIHFAVFDSVISIDARMAMIAAALKWNAALDVAPINPFTAFLAEWEILRKTIRKKYNKRNEVAHSDIIQYPGSDGAQVVELAPFPTFTNSAFQTKLSHRQLMERKNAFAALAREIVEFSDSIRAAQALLPRSP